MVRLNRSVISHSGNAARFRRTCPAKDEDSMSRSVAFRIIKPAGLAIALAFGLTLAAQTATARSATHYRPIYPNLFYGAVPSKGYDLPVRGVRAWARRQLHRLDRIQELPQPLGLQVLPQSTRQGSNNDMYDYAYQAGFRTVFMSMNADNSNNSLSIQTNAAMLQTLFPKSSATLA
jgi:hypothetical protein